MLTLLDNTVLSNFAVVSSIKLLQQAFESALVTTDVVMTEFEAGVARGRLPETDLSWLTVLTLTQSENALCKQLLRRLNAGEASCLAVAAQRQGRIFTDDQDARRIAAQMRIPISGTLGLLVFLVEKKNVTLGEANSLLQAMIHSGYRTPLNILDSLI